MQIMAGIDTHKDTLAVAVVDDRGRQQHAGTIANTAEGFVRLTAQLRQHNVDVVGIEGSGGFGRPVALHLQRQGLTVVEVPPQLTAVSRRQQRSHAKTDEIDAALIARIVLREPRLPVPRPDDAREDLRVLVRYRRELLKERNGFANRLHADLESHLSTAPRSPTFVDPTVLARPKRGADPARSRGSQGGRHKRVHRPKRPVRLPSLESHAQRCASGIAATLSHPDPSAREFGIVRLRETPVIRQDPRHDCGLWHLRRRTEKR